MRKVIKILLIVAIVLVTFTSCKKKAVEKKEPEEYYTIPLGDYQDTQSQRATLTVTFKNRVYCFEINWANSAFENTRWYFSGPFSIEDGGVVYTNEKCYTDIYEEDGECISTEVYYDGRGKMIYEDGKLYWDDEQEEKHGDAAYNCTFVMIKYED